MKYDDSGVLKILTADYGYLLHNKYNDSCSERVYLGINDSIDNYEEIINENIDIRLIDKIAQFQQTDDEHDALIIDSVTTLAIMQLTM